MDECAPKGILPAIGHTTHRQAHIVYRFVTLRARVPIWMKQAERNAMSYSSAEPTSSKDENEWLPETERLGANELRRGLSTGSALGLNVIDMVGVGPFVTLPL